MARTTRDRRRRKGSQSPSDFVRQNVADAINSGLRKARKVKLSKLQKTQRKIFRSAIAFLKRKGIVSKKIDARKVSSTSGLRKIVRENKALIERREVAYALPEGIPKAQLRKLKADLKKVGYKVKGNKLILPQGQFSRQGKVFAKKVGKRPGGEIVSIPLGPDFEKQIQAAFDSLKKGEWIGFQVEGHNSYNIYQSAYGMIADLSRYAFMPGGKGITHITIFRTKKPQEYLIEQGERRDEQLRKYNQRRTARRRLRRQERRAFEQGMRVNRGH